MSADLESPKRADKDQASFAEMALRLSGKEEDEVRRTGAIDTADEQVETLYSAQYQTSNSPIHRAVWDNAVPRELFESSPAKADPHRPASDRRLARSYTSRSPHDPTADAAERTAMDKR